MHWLMFTLGYFPRYYTMNGLNKINHLHLSDLRIIYIVVSDTTQCTCTKYFITIEVHSIQSNEYRQERDQSRSKRKLFEQPAPLSKYHVEKVRTNLNAVA